MQFLAILSFAIILYGTQAGSLINTRERRYLMSPEMKESLKTKDELVNFLDNAPNFADAFLNMENDQLESLLEGYSIEGFLAANSNSLGELPTNGNDGFETEDPIDQMTTTTRAMERESGAAKLPSAILDSTLKAIGKYSAKKHEVDEHLITASEVFSLLNNATDETFGDTYFKIKNDTLISALKGVWIVAQVASGQAKVHDEKTTNILRNITESLEQLSDKVLCIPNISCPAKDDIEMYKYLSNIGIDLSGKLEPDIIVKIDEIFFDTKVVVPVNSTSSSMIAYIKANTSENKEQFFKYFKTQSFFTVANNIVFDVYSSLINLIDASEFDITKVDQMRSKFARYFFHAYILIYFNGALEERKEIEPEPAYGDIFTDWMKDIRDDLKRVSKYYNENFLPVYVKEHVLKSVLDTPGGNNCDLAQNIIDQLKGKYARQKYVVIVSDSVSKPDQYGYYGYPSRMVMEEEYNGKSVIAFTASAQYWKKKEAFYSQNLQGIISSDVTNKYNTNNLHTLMDFGNNTDGYQTAVYKNRYNPCLRSDMNVSDSLDFEVPSLKWGMWPSSETLSYFVVF